MSTARVTATILLTALALAGCQTSPAESPPAPESSASVSYDPFELGAPPADGALVDLGVLQLAVPTAYELQPGQPGTEREFVGEPIPATVLPGLEDMAVRAAVTVGLPYDNPTWNGSADPGVLASRDAGCPTRVYSLDIPGVDVATLVVVENVHLVCTAELVADGALEPSPQPHATAILALKVDGEVVEVDVVEAAGQPILDTVTGIAASVRVTP